MFQNEQSAFLSLRKGVNMKYLEIRIDTSIEGLDPVVSALAIAGITETVVDDPRDVVDLLDKKEDYQWDYVDDSVAELVNERPGVTVYLEENEENRKKVSEIREAIRKLQEDASEGLFGENTDFGSLEVHVKINDDTEWKDKWKEYFKPARISESIVVKPTWEDYEKQEGDLVIEIDPGMAFGTGTHETTSMCVKMMEKYMKKKDSVLDVGCGSGILSIAGALLGAEDVLGVDIDPVAVEVSGDNIALNKVEDVVTIQYGDLTKGIDYKADIVVANLMADILLILTKDVAKHMKKGGIYILSGILLEKEQLIADCLKENGFEILEIAEDGDWCCPVAKLA